MEPIAIWMVNLHVAVEVETVTWLPSRFWMQFKNKSMGGLYYYEKHKIYFHKYNL